jgi:two-component system CheB/CheR fusion protein
MVESVPKGAPQQIVAIGASAGGIEALQRLLARFAYDHASFVILTHIPPDWKSRLSTILQRHTVFEVSKITQTVEMVVNHAYVLGEGIKLSVQGNVLSAHPRQNERHLIDRFLFTLAESWGHRALAVILSGTGADGAAGLRTIRERGGTTFVQDPASADFGDMPRNARPYADYCMTPEVLGDKIMKVLRGQSEGAARGLVM